MKQFIAILAALAAVTLGFGFAAEAAPKAHYTIAWSHYTGWEPLQYAVDSGILAKWAKKYGVKVKLVLVNDYVESINQYTAGNFDGVAITNMDTLTIPALGGVDSTILIYIDYSNGNDGIVTKSGSSVCDLKGKKIMLVELSVSHYLLARALESCKMTERDVTVVNTSDADIGSVYATTPGANAVTWNPILMQARNVPNTKLVFDSSSIPGEIMDLMVVRTDAPEALKRALVGAWYETMEHMLPGHPKRDEAIATMAKFAGSTVAEFEAQLKTTAMFYKAADAAKFVRSPEVKKTMQYVVNFSFDHDLYGAKAKDDVGIQYPDGTVQGNPRNVKIRFNADYMQLAADGKL